MSNPLGETNRTMEGQVYTPWIGNWEWELDSGMMWWSETMFRIWGKEYDSADQSIDTFLLGIRLEDRNQVNITLHKHIKSGKPFEVSFGIKHPNGLEKELSMMGYTKHNRSGRVERVVGIVLDTFKPVETPQNRKENVLKRIESSRLETARHLSGVFAHDINNFLSAVIGYTELLQEVLEEDPEEFLAMAKGGLEKIRVSGERANRFTQKLSVFSGRGMITKKDISLHTTIEGLESECRALLTPAHQLVIDAKAPGKMVRGSVDFISQILAELCKNAAEAMPDGGKLKLSLRECAAREVPSLEPEVDNYTSYVVLAVSDNGHGMDSDLKHRVFEPFITTRKDKKGRGNGLSVVYGIVKQMSGFIQVESTPGEGTTLRMFFPVQSENAIVATPSVEQVEDDSLEELIFAVGAPIEEKVESIEPSKKTLLVCEDEPLIRDIICHTLRATGYIAIEAENGIDAIDKARSHNGSIDLLISDISMPEMDGIELVAALQGFYPELSVLFVSGRPPEEVKAAELGASLQGFLQKPFKSSVLIQRVSSILE